MDLPNFPAASPHTDELHVWGISITDPPLPLDTLRATLSDGERTRIDRLHGPDDYRRAVVARGTLRTILGAYLGIPAIGLVFRYESRGKPYLKIDGAPALTFSVSHSGDWILIGVANRHRVGADIERLRPVRDLERIVDRYFAPSECAALHTLADSARLEAFFTCWTRKEAYVKALGGGISLGLSNFAVTLGGAESPAILEIDGSEAAAARWSVWSADPAPGYTAAVVVEATGIRVTPRRWSGSIGVVPWAAEPRLSEQRS